jgi:Inorganic pyrophosphatase
LDHAVNIVIESPRGSTVTLKYDPNFEVFTLSRPLADGPVYPYDWGFVPSTRASDGIESFFRASMAFERKDLTFCGWSGVSAAYEPIG